MNTTTMNLSTSDDEPRTSTRSKRKLIFWSSIFVTLLSVFTFSKLTSSPRIHSYLFSRINQMLAPAGYQLSSDDLSLGVFLGLSLKMRNVALRDLSSGGTLKLEQVKLTPSLTSALLGELGGSLLVENAGGELDLGFSIKESRFSLELDADDFSLSASDLLGTLLGIKASSGTLLGQLQLKGDLAKPSELRGKIDLTVNQLKLAPQTLQTEMFPLTLPAAQFSTLHLEALADAGKLQIKNLRVGDPKKETDDIRGQLSGEITLGSSWDRSELNLKTQFTLSESLRKIFFILDTFMGETKQNDGSYLARLTGPLFQPTVGSVKP